MTDDAGDRDDAGPPLWAMVAFAPLGMIIGGAIGSVLGLVVVTVRWVAGLIGWGHYEPGWVDGQLDWQASVWVPLLVTELSLVTYALPLALGIMTFRVVRQVAKRRMKAFALQYPEAFGEFDGTIGDPVTNAAVWFACSIVSALFTSIVYAFGVRSVSWIVAGSVTAALGLFYVGGLLQIRRLGRWVFAYARRLVLPYVVLVTPIFVLLSFITLLQPKILVSTSEALGLHTGRYIPWWNGSYMDLRLWEELTWQPIDLFRALAVSLTALLFVVWFIPVVAAGEVAEGVAITVAVLAPWAGEQVLQRTELADRAAQLFTVVPLPVLALLAAVTVDVLFDRLAQTVRNVRRCPVCAARFQSDFRYCPHCGTAVPDAARVVDLPNSPP